jgi:hypothetical protein
VVTKFHLIHRRRLEISDRVEAYIQSLVLKKTLESIFLDFRRNKSLEDPISVERTDKDLVKSDITKSVAPLAIELLSTTC